MRISLNKKSQIGLEYIVIMGFALIIIMGVLALAYIYSGSIKDKIKMTQVNNFATKVITNSESVYYYGSPSKSTISTYLPDDIRNITVLNSSIYIEVALSTGINKIEYRSNVPLYGSISTGSGIKKIVLTAEQSRILISK